MKVTFEINGGPVNPRNFGDIVERAAPLVDALDREEP